MSAPLETADLLIYFVYGLSFFTLGITLFVRPAPQYMVVFRPILLLLAGFGLLHALTEWLILANLVWGSSTVPLLLISTVSGASFACLFMAGTIPVDPSQNNPSTWKRFACPAITISFIPALLLAAGGVISVEASDAWSRWIIGGPGALLVASRFYRLTLITRHPEWGARIPRQLANARPSLLVYSLLATSASLSIYGLSTFFGPAMDMPPMSLVNQDTFLALAGFKIQLLRTVVALILTASIFALLREFQHMDRQFLENQIRAQTRELRNNETRLVQYQERLNIAQALAGMAYFERDVDEEFAHWSDKFFDIAGLEHETNSFPNADFLELVHPDDKPVVLDSIRTAAEDQEGVELRYRLVRPDGEVRHLHSFRKHVPDEAGNPNKIIGVIIDVTEETLQEQRLRQSQRMEAVGQLTGGVAHDFNNLLHIMLGNAEILKMTGKPDAEVLDAILDAIEKGSSLTNRLLSFARQQTLEARNTQTTTLVLGLEDMLRRTLGETIDLRIYPGEDVWPVFIDVHQFENAVVNLAINARDAMPEGGSLTIETSNFVVDEQYAKEFDELEPGEYVKISVSDDGCGIEKENINMVFEPFYTTKEFGKGSGLGLSMVFGFIMQSNGHITIYSEVGEGTTVNMYLPRASGTTTASSPGRAQVDYRRGAERVLVVEDDADVRRVPCTILRQQGYRVTEAEDSRTAIELLDRESFDVLFTDVVLPGGMNGKEIAEYAQRVQPGIRVLFTTGYTENAVVHNGRLDNGVILLNKPYRRSELLMKFQEILED